MVWKSNLNMPFHILHHLLCDPDPSPDDHSLLRWISADEPHSNNASFGILDPAPSFGFLDDAAVPQFQHPTDNPDSLVVELLYKAAEAVSAANSPLAHQILARLNHHLILTSNAALHRAASHFATALLRLDSAPLPHPSPSDTVFKMAAHKLFSEVSPLTHFLSLTAAQALLDCLPSAATSVHVIDFDIGFGDHWASFLQDLPLPRPSVTITALASPATHHLLRHTLSAFAADLAVPFHLHLHDPSSPLPLPLPLPPRSCDLVAAVNFPLRGPPPLLRVLGLLSPDVVVSSDRPSDLPYPQRVVQALHSHAALLESLDAAGAAPDALHLIHRFLLQPRAEAALLLQHHHSTAPSSSGLLPAAFSQLAEAQAECVVKRAPARGFHVEKRGQCSLALCWQRRELVSVSAWRRCSST